MWLCIFKNAYLEKVTYSIPVASKIFLKNKPIPPYINILPWQASYIGKLNYHKSGHQILELEKS